MASISFPFVSTYEKYKKRTDDIARFLDETARKLGIKKSEPEPSSTSNQAAPPPPPPPTAKKKTGKKARAKEAKAASKPATTTTTRNIPKNRIRLSEFIKLAEGIRNQPPPPIELPSWVVPAIDYTVSLRQRAARFYTARVTDDAGEESVQKHQHFINVLEKVKELLAPLQKPQAAAPTPTPEPANKATEATTTAGTSAEPAAAGTPGIAAANAAAKENLVNRFAALNMEESLETDAYDAPSPAGPGAAVFDEDDDDGGRDNNMDEEEVESRRSYFAIFCLFEDLNKIREYISEVWAKYKRKEDGTDLMTASLVTNTAIDLVRRMDEQFRQEFPLLNSYKNTGAIYYMMMCISNGLDPMHREKPEDAYNMEMSGLAEWLFMGTYAILNSFTDVIMPGQIPVMKRGHFGIYEPKADRSKMDIRKRRWEDKIILCDVLPEFATLAFGPPRIQNWREPPALDELSKGLRQMCVDKEIPVWLVFATQIFLDINHSLRDTIGDGLKQLQRSCKAEKETLADALKANEGHGRISTIWPKQNDNAFKGVIAHIDFWVLWDTMKQAKEALLRRTMGYVQPEDEAYFLLSRHPLLCGIMQFTTTLMTRQCGITLSMAWGSMVYTAHLYNALRQSRDVELPEWPDMEYLLSMHGDFAIFHSATRPRSKNACMDQYNEMMGTMASGGGLDWDKMSAIVSTLGDRYNAIMIANTKSKNKSKAEEADWTVDKVERLINAASPTPVSRRRLSSDGTSIIRLLTSLSAVMAQESPKLQYDYVSMHRRGLRLLFALKEELHGTLEQCFGPRYLDAEYQISTIVGWILKARTLKNAGEEHNQLFVRSADVMRKFIEEEGNVEIDKVKRLV